MSDPDITLIENPMYSVSHVFSTDDITVTFDGDTIGSLADPLLGLDTTGVNGTKSTKDGNTTLYPINSEFGFLVTDFDGAEDKDFFDNPEYTEGWAGNLLDESQQQAGIVVSNAETDTFKTPALLGTWLAGLGGNTVKASTEHYVVMQNILSDQKYPGDPDAEYALDNDLKVVGGDYDGYSVMDLLNGVEVDGIGFVDVGDVNGDGVEDIKDILSPNESSIKVDIAASTDYSVTLKDDGKLLYRWGNTVKRPNDIRLEVEMELPEEWSTPEENTELLPLFRITAAELVTQHTITNNPNDQIRPEDYENEAAIGQLPTYTIISDYNEDGNGPREVWVTTDDYYAGDGTLYPSGTILRDDYLAEIWANSEMAALGAQDGAEGFTNAWYTTMDREPFTADYDTADDQYAPGAEYDVGPRWRLQPDKYGQDLPSVVIPSDPSLPPPPTKDEVKYEVGADTTTVINLLDWGFPVSPLSISAGWQNEAGSVTGNGVSLSQNFDVAFYIKGDIKPATLYNTELRLNFEEITINDTGAVIAGGAEDDYLVGQGDNLFSGGADGDDLFVLSYGTTTNWAAIQSSVITDFKVGKDTLGLIGLGVTDTNFDSVVGQTVEGSDLVVTLAGVEIATLEGVTEELGMEESFLLINPSLDATDEIVGTDDPDRLVGDALTNRILGLGGDDTILGWGGNDTLIGDDDNDALIGGDGDDLLLGGDGDDTLMGGTDNDLLDGGEGSDIYFADGTERVSDSGTSGYDVAVISDAAGVALDMTGWSGVERINGFTGDDTIDGSSQTTELLVFGSEGNDVLSGGSANDSLFGGAGDDLLAGGAGDDVLVAGDDNDTLDGGSGKDFMIAGEGLDVFVFEDGFGRDVVKDFTSGVDLLDFSGVSGVSATGDLVITQVGDHTAVRVASGYDDILILADFVATDLLTTDFDFA